LYRDLNKMFTSRVRLYGNHTRAKRVLQNQLDSTRVHPKQPFEAPPHLDLSMNIESVDHTQISKLALLASKNSVTDLDVWKRIIMRTEQLSRQMLPGELVTIICVSTKARAMKHASLEMFFPIIKPNLSRLTANQIGNVFSAYAKNGFTSASTSDVFVRELRSRLHEFNAPTDLSVVSNCLCKFEIKDEQLLKRFAAHVQSRLSSGYDLVPVRDASVIAQAVVGLPGFSNFGQPALQRLAQHASQTLDQATPLELARLLQAYLPIPSFKDFSLTLVTAAERQAAALRPEDLSTALFSFGQVLERVSTPEVTCVISRLTEAVVAALPRFQSGRDLAQILSTYARWKFQLSPESAGLMLGRMVVLVEAGQRAEVLAAAVSAGVAIAGSQAHALGEACQPGIQAAVMDLEISSLGRAVEALTQLGMLDIGFQAALTSAIICRHGEVRSSKYFRSVVHACLTSQGVSKDEDVMLLLIAE
jgi:hypothetical protein